MQNWVDKVKPYLSYMTEVIDAVKGQAVSMNASTMTSFTAKELIARTQILLKNELKRRHCTLNLDIDVDDFIYALDQTHRLIYVYDNECNMLGGFGGTSGSASQLGIFNNPGSLLVHGDNILVADGENLCVTVFELTDYGRILKEIINVDISSKADLLNIFQAA